MPNNSMESEGSNLKAVVEPTQEATRDEPLLFVFGEVTYTPKTESSIPREVTESILRDEILPAELPPLGSSTIEDFITSKVRSGITSTDEIVEAFFNEGIPQQIEAFVAEVEATSARLEWDKIFTANDAKDVQRRVVTEMQAMGATPDQVAVVAAMEVGILEGIGVSSLTEDLAYVSRLQAVRKAIDYRKAFEDQIPLESVITSIMSARIGHELGHKVDGATGIASNRIPNEWKNSEGAAENRGERFAEAWGRMVLDDETEKAVTHKEWILQVAKVNEVWTTIRQAKQQVDLFAIFRGIEERLGPENNNTSTLLYARRALYGGNEVENYALPYNRDTVTSVIHTS